MPSSEHPFNNPLSTLTTRKVIAGVLVVLSVIFLFYLFYQFRILVMLVFTGIVISISMEPAVDWLHQHKLPRGFSVILIYLGLLIFFVAIIYLVIPQTIHQVVQLTPKFESIYSDFRFSIQNSPIPFVRQWMSNLPLSLNSLFVPGPPAAAGTGLSSISWTLTMALSILGGLFSLIVLLLLAFYWTLEGEKIEYALSLLLPLETRESARVTIQEIKNRVGGFVRGEGLLSLAIGSMALISYLIIGLPSVLPLAFLAGGFELVPIIGPALGAIPAVLVAFEANPSKIIWVILATIIIQLLENHLLVPRIMQKTVGVNPIVTILSFIAFGSLFGVPGILMAVPLAAVAQVILDRLLLHPDKPVVVATAGRDRVSKLSYETQEFVEDVRKLVRRKNGGPSDVETDEIEDAIETIATDLELLLERTEPPGNSP